MQPVVPLIATDRFGRPLYTEAGCRPMPVLGSMVGVDNNRALWLQVLISIFSVMLIFFLFLLPVWSWISNDKLGFLVKLCETPATELTCGNGANYEEIAISLGRFAPDGTPIGCSCEDGILQDWACATDVLSFSISYFISTAPGTGSLAAISAWPVLGMWLHGATSQTVLEHIADNECAQNVLFISLAAFQFFYGLFLINTLCIVANAHYFVVTSFIIAMIVHYVVLAWVVTWDSVEGKAIICLLAVGIGGLAIGSAYPVGPSWIGQHAFWLGECVGLSCGFLVAPVLILIESMGMTSLQQREQAAVMPKPVPWFA